MVDLAMYRKATAESRQKQGLDKCHTVRDVLKDEGFPSARLPYKPVDLLVAASPPTMDAASSFGASGANLPPEEEAAATRTEIAVDVAKAELTQEDLSGGTASAIANGINGEGPTAKKYTSLLFTNVAGCFSDEVRFNANKRGVGILPLDWPLIFKKKSGEALCSFHFELLFRHKHTHMKTFRTLQFNMIEYILVLY